MSNKSLEPEPECDQGMNSLRLEVEALKREEDRFRSLRQEKEEQLRTIIYKELKNK
jgi:hypothetical protein